MTRRARAIPSSNLWRFDRASERRAVARVARRRRETQAGQGFALDPKTGQVRQGRIERRAFGVTLHLPKRLNSGNSRDKQHWRRRFNERLAWADCIRVAALDSCPAGRRLAWQTTPAGAVGWMAPPMRVRLTVSRLVTNERHFFDYDNLATGAKPLVDSLVEAGFLKDDSTRHVDRVYEQGLSPDGLVWTVVDIAAPEGQP